MPFIPDEQQPATIQPEVETRAGKKETPLETITRVGGMPWLKYAPKVAEYTIPRVKKYITEEVPAYYRKGMPTSYREQLTREAEMAPKALAAAGEVGAWTLPVTKLGRGATLGQKIMAGAGLGARVGGLYGITGETEAPALSREAIGERFKAGGVGALTGGVIGGAIPVGAEAVGKVGELAKRGAGKIYETTLKTTKTIQKLFGKYGGEEKMVLEALERGEIKSQKGLIRKLTAYRPEFEREVEGRLKQSDKTIDLRPILRRLRKVIKDDLDNPETAEAFKQATKYLDSIEEKYVKYAGKVTPEGLKKVPVEIPAESANRIRKRIDQKVGGKILEEIRGGKAYVMKEFATELRNAVKGAVPATKPFFRKYSFLSDLIEVSKREPRLGLYEVIAVLTGHPELVGATYGFRSPTARRLIATGMYRGGKVAEKMAETPDFLTRLVTILGAGEAVEK